MSGLFENLASQDDSAIVANRKASAVAVKRVKDRFGAFLANAHDTADRSARIALVEDDIQSIISDTVDEYGGNLDHIAAAIKIAMEPTMPGAAPVSPGMAPQVAPQPGMGTGACPHCGSPLVNGQCPNCQGAQAQAAPTGAPGFGMNHTIPQQPSTGPIQASKQAKGGFCDECRKWKSGPKAGCTCAGEPKTEEQDVEKEASRLSFTPIEETPITLRPGMNDGAALAEGAPPSDQYGQGLGQSLEGMGQQMGNAVQNIGTDATNPVGGALAGGVENMGQNMFGAPQQAQPYHNPNMLPPSHMAASDQVSITTPPISYAAPLDESGEGGVTDINGELENAPTAVGHGTMASTTQKEAEALKTVKLPKGNKDSEGGPSPKIDKGKSGDEQGWNLEPINTEMDGSPNPTVTQDVTDGPDYTADFLDQTDAVTEKVELDSAPDFFNDAGFAKGGEEHGDHTKTFPKGNQAKPVTSAVDPEKNPVAEILKAHDGALLPYEVDNALKDWTVG